MKKLILMLLIFLSSSIVKATPLHILHFYKDVPRWFCKNEDFMCSVFMSCVWSTKNTHFTFEQHNCKNEKTTFVAYNGDCIIFLRVNRETGDCEIEFDSDDSSYNYFNFKNLMDFYFLYS